MAEDTDDFDRPLAERGIENAHKMAAYLMQNGIHIDQFISSPALRALHTCEIFNETYHIEILTNRKLYNANENNFESVIYDLNDDLNSVAMFSHNNGISNFANMMSGDIFAFPTCGVAGFQVDCESWADFEGAKKKLLFFMSRRRSKL
ncbi:histidine phosphatase family protein [Kaistella anthropi]|nr:histidine phosphatase family protein [Kaistella anthropi]